MLAALTLLPAVLSLSATGSTGADPGIGRRAINSAGSEGRFWSVLVGGVMRRPLVSLVAATALLLAAAAAGALDRHGTVSGLSTLPDRFPSKQGFDALNRDFPGTGVDPAQIVVHGAVSSAPVRSAIEQLEGEPCRRGRVRRSDADQLEGR